MPTSFAVVRRCLLLALLALLGLGLVASGASAADVTASGVTASATSASATSASDPGAETTLAQDEGAPDSDRRVVQVLPLRDGFLDPPVVAQILDVLDEAEERGAELVVLSYSSAGGVSVDLDLLLDRLEASSVPIAVLIGPLGTAAEARGAAGLLWLAADVRSLSADATVGPLDPVDLAADPDAFDLADTTAELVAAAGGDVEVVEALVEGALDPDALADAGLVTVTAQSLEPLLVELDGVTVTTAAGERELNLRSEGLQVRFHSLGLIRRVLHAATTAPFIYLLLVVGLGMLLFEVFQPGFGVAGIAGLVTAAVGVFGLTVLPVTWWAVALVVLGLLLYAVDTAIAGFGPVTAAATVAFVVGSLSFYDADALGLPVWLVVGTTLTVFVFFVFVMTTILRAQAGPEGVTVEQLVGRPGVVRSVLNPEGHVYVDGALWRARWTGESRRAKVGTPVRVHGVDGAVVLVDAFDPDAVGAAPARSRSGEQPPSP